MKQSQSDRVEIIRLVEESLLPARRTLEILGIACVSARNFGSDANLVQPLIIRLRQVVLQEGRVSRARTSGA